MSPDDQLFRELKGLCVPLSSQAVLTPSSIPVVLDLLSKILGCVENAGPLSTALISYTFFPLSAILRLNTSHAIPDQVFEKVLAVLAVLWESWWWECELTTWDQTFMLCGGILGDLESKGKGRARDDETKAAAAKCLLSMLRQRTPEDPGFQANRYVTRLAQLQQQAQAARFLPIFGETLNSLLLAADSHHMPLQVTSLCLLDIMIRSYAPLYFIPSILPGVVSGMTKLALGISGSKRWTNAQILAGALGVMQTVIVMAIGDDICAEVGIIHIPKDLEDLVELVSSSVPSPSSLEDQPFSTPRTASWLQGTASQLHIALNSLTPLLAHPKPTALLALVKLSSALLAHTAFTLPQTQPLLLSLLLSLSVSVDPSVSDEARTHLLMCFSGNSANQPSLTHTLLHITRSNLAALPRLITMGESAKVKHTAGLVEAACRLASSKTTPVAFSSITGGIQRLLGPTGGVEKWGWGLLSVLEFVEPPISVMSSHVSTPEFMLEGNSGIHLSNNCFPQMALKYVQSTDGCDSLVDMFHALGSAAGESALFAVEWFLNIGLRNNSRASVAALWSAAKLLEGVSGVDVSQSLDDITDLQRKSKRVKQSARGFARRIAELWDEPKASELSVHFDPVETEGTSLEVEHRQGVNPVLATLAVTSRPLTASRSTSQPLLHKSIALQIISISAAILQNEFGSLLLHTFYPILHSIVSPFNHLTTSGLAALACVARETAYASVPNLLLSNFDYALDSVARRLTRHWLDVDAAKVLLILIRLVGAEVVERAGDVLEECFDRLDEFHGYSILVEGLVEVMAEVIRVIKVDTVGLRSNEEADGECRQKASPPREQMHLEAFFTWFPKRHEDTTTVDDDVLEPTPREAWGSEKRPDSKVEKDNETGVGDRSNSTTSNEVPLTPVQTLSKQIVSRSMYFLTHGSPAIRARILALLSSSIPILSESTLLPSIHQAWPFILNRLNDPEPFVIGAAASLVEALVAEMGGFMYRRLWDDVWPRFFTLLKNLDAADLSNALSRRGVGAVSTESAYTHSHRLYRSLLKAMAMAVTNVDVQDSALWQVILSFRRFLHKEAHEELQTCARDLYIAIGRSNKDAVWLALSSTTGDIRSTMAFLLETKWDIRVNMSQVFDVLMLSS